MDDCVGGFPAHAAVNSIKLASQAARCRDPSGPLLLIIPVSPDEEMCRTFYNTTSERFGL
jgi:hypothetical protein